MSSAADHYARMDARMSMPDEDWQDFALRAQASELGSSVTSSSPQTRSLQNATETGAKDVLHENFSTEPVSSVNLLHEDVSHSRVFKSTAQANTDAQLAVAEVSQEDASRPFIGDDVPEQDAPIPSRKRGVSSPSKSPLKKPNPLTVTQSDPLSSRSQIRRNAGAVNPVTVSVAELQSHIDEISAFTEVESPIKRRKLNSAEDSNITTPGSAPPVAVSKPKPSKLPKFNIATASTSARTVKGKRKAKERILITPIEYAKALQARLAEEAKSEVERQATVSIVKRKLLAALTIYYIGGDNKWASELTQRRMDYIIENGGTVLPTFDPAQVTHIVTDAGERPTLRALGLKKLTDIPDHIPTITWGWVLTAKTVRNDRGQGTKIEMGHEFIHAAFASRIDAGKPFPWKDKGKQKANKSVQEMKPASGFIEHEGAVGAKPAYLPPGAPSQRHTHDEASRLSLRNRSLQPGGDVDPLAEFEALAKAEIDAENMGLNIGDLSEPDDLPPSSPTRPASTSKLRGFLCDDPTKSISAQSPEACINQDVVDKLSELMELHRAKLGDDDKWRVFSYSKAIRALRSYPLRISSIEQARSLKGVGEKTALKIMEILETGSLRRIGYERTEDIAIVKLFAGIYNVGQRTAHNWYSAGCRTLDDLRNGKAGIKLSDAQQIGLKFYKDINTRMPRDEAREIFEAIETIALSIDSRLFVKVMGSYRRGKATCGDIDILVTRPTDDGKTHSGFLSILMQKLHSVGILTEDLSVPSDDEALDAVYHGLCLRPLRTGEATDSPRLRRRIDFLTVPWESRGAALIYYTGDDIFNRSLRLKASKMGYSLNQRGLYGGVVRSPEDRTVKLSPGSIIASETEEEIFRILGVPWQEPHERIRG